MSVIRCTVRPNRTKARVFKPRDAVRILKKACSSADPSEFAELLREDKEVRVCIGRHLFDCQKVADAYLASQELFDIGRLVSKLAVIIVAVLASIAKLPFGKMFAFKVGRAIASLLGIGVFIEDLIKNSEALRELLSEMAEACQIEVQPATGTIREIVEKLDEIEGWITDPFKSGGEDTTGGGGF